MKILYAMVSNNTTGLHVQCYGDVKNAIRFVRSFRSPNVCFLFFNQSCLFQVVEVAIYVEHLLRECENKGKYQQCPRCSEAIGNDFDIHIKLKECHETKPNTSRCPLCHMNIPEGDEAWRNHLMGADGCVKNSRRGSELKQSNV